VNLLERKGIISNEDFFEEIKKVQAAMLTAEK
jgi:hypothetical protein